MHRKKRYEHIPVLHCHQTSIQKILKFRKIHTLSSHRIYSIPKTNHTRNIQISRCIIETMKTNISTTSLSKKMRLQQQEVEESATYWTRNWRTGPEESDRRSRRRGVKSGRREGEEGRLRRSRLRRRRRCLSLAGVSSANMAAARRSEAVSAGGLGGAAIIPTISGEGNPSRRRWRRARPRQPASTLSRGGPSCGRGLR